MIINFISSGRTGDFIHCLSVVKNICEKSQAKANIYLTDKARFYGGDTWSLGVNRAHQDLINTVTSQPFVNKFEVLEKYLNEPYINLNIWRDVVMKNYNTHGFFSINWSDFLSQCYKFEISKPYKWINIDKVDADTKDKVVIHRSLQRHNNLFNWKKIIEEIEDEIIFITCSPIEWQSFPFKSDKIKLKVVYTLDEMVVAINSSKLFIGNQSSPFAIASALDVNRLVELNNIDARFYMKEKEYSENISWYLNDNKKYFNEKLIIKL